VNVAFRFGEDQKLGGAPLMLYAFVMTQLEQGILAALLDLERAVEAMPRSNPKPDLRPMFSRLDELTASLPVSTEPLLLHYLHKKSYQKARLFLEGCDAENARGNCHGHVDQDGRAWNPQSGASVGNGGKTHPAR
jgi:hypothetical protein